MEHKPGDIIYGRYRIISVIGGGGFGKTYKVEDGQSPGLVCLIKYLSPQSNSPLVLKIAEERFRKEADILRRLGSYNQRVPQLYNYFQENQKFYLVQEYIQGKNLQDEIKTQTLNEEQVIDVLYDVLTTLDYLSINNVIHRDIKPANLVRRERDKKIFLIDFGAVKEVAVLAVNHEGQTVSTMAIGTPYYMPPEQRLGRPEFASDIYALGITALTLLTGRIPQKNHNDEVIWNGVQLSQDFGKILEKMVRPNHYERYKTAGEVLIDLEPLTLLGQTVNQRYRINRYLGTGELGYTYLAEDQQRPYEPNCIIKKLKLRTNNQQILQEVSNRFATATKKAEELSSHPQIPKLLNHFQVNKEFYLVYEFIDGEPLSKQITASNYLSEAEVITMLKDVLSILSIIHKQEIIHGDIKPSNLIKRKTDNKICLIDFAEFKQLVNLDINPQKIVVKPGGTDGYMPPEQLKSQLKPCTDIYALGMTAIQALTGVSPEQLPTDSKGEVVWRNQRKVSPRLAKILTKMVRFQFGQRYQSAKEVLNNLKTITWWGQLRKPLPILVIITVVFGIFFIIREKYETDSYNEAAGLTEKGARLTLEGDFDGAKNAYEQALKVKPNFIRALVGKGFLYSQKGEFKEQFETCEAATTVDSNFSGAWLCRGNAARSLGIKLAKSGNNNDEAEEKLQESRRYFNEAIALACESNNDTDKEESLKNCTDSLYGKGDSFLESQKPDLEKALQEFEKAIKKDPKHVISLTGKGKVLLAQNSAQEALEAFNKALDIKENYQPAKEGKQAAEKLLGGGNPKSQN